MKKHLVMKWIFYICIASFLVNGMIYLATKSNDSLISLLSATALGLVMGIGALLTRKSN